MNYSKILLSIGTIAVVGAVAAGVTAAFYASEAESQGNTFNSGTLNLEINPLQASGGWGSTILGVDTPGYGALNPGGDKADLSTGLRNVGTSDAAAIGLAVEHTLEENNIADQMRITQLDWKGESLLEGGAGANIGEYTAPATCDITVDDDDSETIQTNGIDLASLGETVCVEAGTYNEDLTIDRGITLAALNAPDSTNRATIEGRIDVDVNDVTIQGFEITNPNVGNGVVLNSVTGGVINHNIFTAIGSGSNSGTSQAVYLNYSSAEVTSNVISNVGNLSANGSSKGIFIGDSSGSATLSGIVIENNSITDIKASTNTFANGGKGAYGVLINHGGVTDGVSISNNTIVDLEGLWSHAIGLEGDTPNAIVTLNDINDIVDHKGNTDAVAVFFESNPSAASVLVNENNLVAPLGVAVHSSLTGLATIDATNNWWGDFDATDQISTPDGTIDYSPIAGGPHVGFINGTDQNSNGFADLRDLELSPIVNAEPGLDAGDTDQLDFFVQLDGPTTGNSYQDSDLTSDFTFTLGQIVQ
ncbi:MAG: right-handed parallel beta-helix repeat-containing protein [Candidatus Paceibacterota bacterium]